MLTKNKKYDIIILIHIGGLIMKQIKVTRCVGEGQSECRRCKHIKGWHRIWMCFLYKIEGIDGFYCLDCVKEILKELDKKQKICYNVINK